MLFVLDFLQPDYIGTAWEEEMEFMTLTKNMSVDEYEFVEVVDSSNISSSTVEIPT